jgi:hypothetical protein
LLPSDATLHEFRGLTLFAQGNYKDAAATLYAVLAAGPAAGSAVMETYGMPWGRDLPFPRGMSERMPICVHFQIHPYLANKASAQVSFGPRTTIISVLSTR